MRTAEGSGFSWGALISLILGVMAFLALASIFWNTSNTGTTFIKQCNIGKCIKLTARCQPPGTVVNHGECILDVNGEERQGECYGGYEPPQGCLLNPDEARDIHGGQVPVDDVERGLTDYPTNQVYI